MSDAPAAMDLDEFVKSTILQIVQGMNAASTEVSTINQSAIVNPRFPEQAYADPISLQFDVAVTVSARSGLEAGGNVKVFSAFQAGGKGERGHEHETMSRVQFELPIALPSTAISRYPKGEDPHGYVGEL
jgi:hypothetical protein